MHNTTTHPPPQPPQILKNPKNDVVYFQTFQSYNRHDPRRNSAAISPPLMFTSVIAAATSWLRNRRIRYLFLFLCSPLLLVALPFLCAAELCLRRRLWRKLLSEFSGDDGGDRLRRCEEGGSDEEEKGLLHRYLEDQLLLVRSMYECGDEEDQEECKEDSRRVEDIENLNRGKVPLLR